MTWVVAIDKFRGTATQEELSTAIAEVADRHGIETRLFPTSDGGEGLLDVVGGPNRRTSVTGPLGEPVEAGWFADQGGLAVIESARASGLLLAGGDAGNDPWNANSRGTGELVRAAREAGADHIVIGLGGSACTDGGRGALDVLLPAVRQDPGLGRALTVCVDVDARFLDAAVVFGPQKGADAAMIGRLTERLRRERRRMIHDHGVDPQEVTGSGAAGGMAGAFACLGATLVPGFDHVAQLSGLDTAMRTAELVITGEGRLDATSFAGKVVGGVAALAQASQVPVVAIVGAMTPGVSASFPVISLTHRFGRDRAFGSTLACVREATESLASDTPVPDHHPIEGET
ncbi:glycerate kinase [Aeromicrobium sp. YIM 150415]|uniref:glycerate kinase n=1 Tax=Aeromicrobium sp. YIM 150415 TaxID=2803912 RepID=UPI0019665AB8|nr:glycerate kinase [Aeromicrobium sp. YIM 150415]MBM9461973.1 glycerate kinase [Aeromicrobium sp. YIM 150415]